jgi:polyhydroxyalkanoate synthesis regulator protein
MSEASKSQLIVVKRYARSRLYDTTNSRYVSVEQLRRWVSEGVTFCVIDAEDGVDITRVLLA